MNLKKTAKLLLSALLAVALLYFAFRGIDWELFWNGLLDTRWAMVLLSILCALLSILFKAFRWQDLLNAGKGREDRYTLGQVWNAANIGSLTSLVVPAVGELVKCNRLGKSGKSFASTFGTVIIERAWDVIMVILVTVCALVCNMDMILPFFTDTVLAPLQGKVSVALLAVLLVLFAALGVYLVYKLRDRYSICRKAVDFFKNILDGLRSFGRLEHKFIFLFHTLLVWLMYVLTVYFIFKSVPALAGLNFADALFISAIGNFTHLLPVPGGIGAYHYIVALSLASIFGTDWETGILMATLSHESHAIILLALGVISLIFY